MRDLRGKVAVVTGASSGIGRATALELARRGCDVAMVCKSKVDKLEATAAEVRALGRWALSAQVDVSDPEAVFAFADRVVADLGTVHILVNNAGVGLVAPVADVQLSDFEWLMGINFWGVVYCTKAFLPHLQKNPSHIVNVSSVWGLLGSPGQTAYTSSKFAVVGFTEVLYHENRDSGVQFACVCPDVVKTPLLQQARDTAWPKMMDAGTSREPEEILNAIEVSLENNEFWVFPSKDAKRGWWARRFIPELMWKHVHKTEGW